MKPLRILVLHAMGPRDKWFPGVADVELMFPRYDRSNEYLVHNAFIDFPKFIFSDCFNAIIMMSTFMDKVASEGLDGRWIRQYEFIKSFCGVKLAFPQDDYWFSEARDQFYVDYSIHRVHPVCSKDSWPELIPKYLKTGGDVKQGYTTYITPMMRALRVLDKPLSDRENYVVYRASKSPKAPNRYGYIKGVIGERFLSEAVKFKLSFDISTDPKALIHGDSWYHFIANSRAILGSNSGSTVRLRNNETLSRLNDYRLSNPEMTGEEIAAAIFDLDDRDKSYTAISPRNVEAAMLGTVQILVEGSYSDLLEPHEDYLVLREDCGNVEEILDLITDDVLLHSIAENCRAKLLGLKFLQVEHVIADTVDFIRENNKCGDPCCPRFFAVSLRAHNIYSNFLIVIKKYSLLFFLTLVRSLPSSARNVIKSYMKRNANNES